MLHVDLQKAVPLAVVAWGCAVGSPHPTSRYDLSVLELTTDEMSINLVRAGDTTPVGTQWDALSIVQHANGRSALRRVYRTENRLFGPHLDTAIATVPGLVPAVHHVYSELASSRLVYSADSVTGWAEDGRGGRYEIAQPLPPHAIDASLFDLVVRSVDWDAQRVLEVPAFLSTDNDFVTLRATFERVESVRQRDGTLVECWRVHGEFSNITVTMWIDRAGRGMAREIIHIAPDVAMHMLR